MAGRQRTWRLLRLYEASPLKALRSEERTETMAPIGWKIAAEAVLTASLLVVVIVRWEQLENRFILGIGLLWLSSILGIVDEIGGLGVDLGLAMIVLSGAALLVFLLMWLSDREAVQSSTHD